MLTHYSPSLPPCSELSARLNLTREEGEKWIVTLIRDTRLEGKIDLNAVRPSLRFTFTLRRILTLFFPPSEHAPHHPTLRFSTSFAVHPHYHSRSRFVSLSLAPFLRRVSTLTCSPAFFYSRVRSDHELGYAAARTDHGRSRTRWRTRWRSAREEAGGRGGTGHRGEVEAFTTGRWGRGRFLIPCYTTSTPASAARPGLHLGHLGERICSRSLAGETGTRSRTLLVRPSLHPFLLPRAQLSHPNSLLERLGLGLFFWQKRRGLPVVEERKGSKGRLANFRPVSSLFFRSSPRHLCPTEFKRTSGDSTRSYAVFLSPW